MISWDGGSHWGQLPTPVVSSRGDTPEPVLSERAHGGGVGAGIQVGQVGGRGGPGGWVLAPALACPEQPEPRFPLLKSRDRTKAPLPGHCTGCDETPPSCGCFPGWTLCFVHAGDPHTHRPDAMFQRALLRALPRPPCICLRPPPPGHELCTARDRHYLDHGSVPSPAPGARRGDVHGEENGPRRGSVHAD